MVKAGKQVRRVNGHVHLRSLRATLKKATVLSVPPGTMRPSMQPNDRRAVTEAPQTRNIVAGTPTITP